MTTLTDSQKLLRKSLDIASESAIAYAAPEVPELGNATPEGMLEELGRVNEARKALDKVEKILKGRIAAVSGNAKEIDSDNFTYRKGTSERTALNQSLAKEKLGEFGVLEECMTTSEFERVTIKRR